MPADCVRHRIDVEFIEGDRAVLKEGPAIGAVIVTVGAAVLLGIEQKFGTGTIAPLAQRAR